MSYAHGIDIRGSLPPIIFSSPLDNSNQVTRQQEIRNALPHMVLMATITTYQLPLHQLRLDQQRVKIFQHLLITLQSLCRRWFCGEFWEAQLLIFF